MFIFTTPKASKSQDADDIPLIRKILQMDPLGFVLIMGSIICLLLTLQWGGVTKLWSSADVIGVLVGFGLLAIAFIVNEVWQGPQAMLTPHILQKREVWTGSLFSVL